MSEQDVDARLAEEAEERPLGVAGDGRPDVGLGHAAGRGDPGDLVLGGRRADVRVQARGRGGDEVDRDRPAAVRRPQPVDVGGDPIDQLLARRAEVGAGRAARVVAVLAGGRQPAPEILRLVEGLADEARADGPAVGLTMNEPLAWRGNATWATAVTTSG